MNVLYTWIGKSDLRAVEGSGRQGPVADTLLHLPVDRLERVVLLFDCAAGAEELGANYRSWLNDQLRQASKSVVATLAPITQGDPTSFNWVYDAMRKVVAESEAGKPARERHYLVGPGTPTMAACTLILSRLAACKGTLWQVDEKSPQGCRRLELPFDLNLEDGPDPASRARAGEPLNKLPDEVVVDSPGARHAWRLAERAAQSRWPVLILGSTGSGKEELTKHLFEHSGLKGPLRSVNCGAIPDNLIEAELFGYKKGAFTGARDAHPGIFEAAADGMVFLDEVGELPLGAQTKLLRVLQEKTITRLGEHEERSINCRIVAATHRKLWQAVQDGRFRADLYYRLAGLIIELPDLVQRPEDIRTMIRRFWQQIVEENPGFPGRELGDAAHRRLLTHSWPGNVRELKATLVRVAFLAEAPHVTADDVELALAKPGDAHVPNKEGAGVLDLSVQDSISQATGVGLNPGLTAFPPNLPIFGG